MIVTKMFEFEAAHNLKDYDGMCANLHGHSYKLQVSVEGEVDSKGFVLDFKVLKGLVKEKVISKLDHKYLNDIFDQSTAENIIIWIWNQLKDKLNLYEIKLWETSTSFVTYRGTKDEDQ